jgi:hypothetical protein
MTGEEGFKSDLELIIFYHGFFGERFIANLMNYSNSCPSFGACGIDQCVQCKDPYTFSKNIVAAYGMLDPSTLPPFIEEAEDFLPKVIPSADIAVAINLHPDILYFLPEKLKEAGIKGLIVPVEEPGWCSAGLAKQLKERCLELDIEFAAPKPFCTLKTAEETPLLNRFLDEFGVGYPKFEIEVREKDDFKRIESVKILSSEPCGAAWFIGIRLRGFEFRELRELWDKIAEAHHSFPCTASMERDNEYDETLLHVAGYVARRAIDRALGYEGYEEVPVQLEELI